VAFNLRKVISRPGKRKFLRAAGPAELVFSNAVLISYYQVTNSAIRSQSIGNDPIGIAIAPNRTMRLFSVPAPVSANFFRVGNGSVSFTLEPNRPAEFTAPNIGA